MTKSLPANPSLAIVKREAKRILKAHKAGDASCCDVLRNLHHFTESPDESILSTKVFLAEIQFAIALEYGFRKWVELKDHIIAKNGEKSENDEKWKESVPGQVRPPSLEKFAIRNLIEALPKDSPYLGGGVPFGVVQALNQSGSKIDFEEYAAATGWAFSFGYKYDDIGPSYLAVRGNPSADGPYEVFAFIPKQLGYNYKSVPTAEHEKLWEFVKTNTDNGTLMISEHIDGGLVYGYRIKDEKRQLWFDGTVGMGWTDIDSLDPYALYALKKVKDSEPADQITIRALKRAVEKASPHEWNNVPQGLSALEAYYADVANPEKDFADGGGWFCWSAFERLSSRYCCGVWLKRVAQNFDEEIGSSLLSASENYNSAYQQYERYRSELKAGLETDASVEERARTPERIAVLAPILRAAIDAEKQGLENLKKVTAILE